MASKFLSGLMFFSAVLISAFGHVEAKVDLVTLPARDNVQLTIYNSADLTLVRESRTLTLQMGLNQLQFSWENTLIDPTSLEMIPKAQAEMIDVFDLTFPPRVQNLGIFNIESRVSGKVPVEISYLTSGLSWRSFYVGTLSADESVMRLQGYVRVSNHSGEDYDKAQTRLVVGKVNLLDEIAVLARNQYPYGRPEPEIQLYRDEAAGMKARRVFEKVEAEMMMPASAEMKEIAKESISEYYLYTIEGRESIPDQWSKRLPSFDVSDIPVENLYKFDEERFGSSAVRFLKFVNDSKHRLGDTPIPDGQLKVFRIIDNLQHLSYEGESGFKYIPVGEKAELNLGPVGNVIVEPVLMKYETRNHLFYENGNISGWDEVQTFQIKIKNTRDIPVALEIYRHFSSDTWDFRMDTENQPFEKVDKNTVKFELRLDAGTEKSLSYVVTAYYGARAENR